MASFQYEQMESGYTSPLLGKLTSLKYQKWSPSTWIGSIKSFLQLMNAEIQIPHFQYPQLQREREISLMEAFQIKYTGKIYWLS